MSTHITVLYTKETKESVNITQVDIIRSKDINLMKLKFRLTSMREKFSASKFC